MLLVAEAPGAPKPTPSERALLPLRHLPHQRITPVLHHPADVDRPRGTAAWLAERGDEESVDALRTFLDDQRAPEVGRTAI